MNNEYFVTIYNKNSFGQIIEQFPTMFCKYKRAVNYIKEWMDLNVGYWYVFSHNGTHIILK